MPQEQEQGPEDLTALPRGTVVRVSAVIVTSVFIALVLVWLLSGGGSEFFRAKIPLRTYTSDSSGIQPGAFVMLNGVVIGRVEKVTLTSTLDPNRVVEIRMLIQRRYMANIPVDSIAAITATNLVGGDEYVNIALGKAPEHVDSGAEIASLIQSGSFNPADLVASLRDTMGSIDAILTDIEQGQSPLSKVVKGDALYVSISHQLTVLEKSIASSADRKTPNGQLIYSDADYNKIVKMLADLDTSLAQAQSGQGALGKMLTDSGPYDRAVSQARNLHRTLVDDNAGKGKAGQWLVSDAKYQQMEAQIQSLDKTVDQVTDPNSKFGKLLQSRELYDSLNKQAAQLSSFAREIREDPRRFERVKLFGKKKKKTKQP